MQAVSNLLNNAVRHGESGSSIRVRLTSDAEGVTIEVHNRGSIPKETADHLFEPFVSRPAQPTPKQGLGLGLYIVDQIVRGHGGRVEVRSGPEEGTAFSIRVPRDPLSNDS
jgi:signal transduction histidine kinase